jgi:5-methyltetrahydrofolate--homocysteine methyltransferase
MIGGATTSPLHTALKIAPVYEGPVVHLKDASQNALVAARLMNPDLKEDYVQALRHEQAELRQKNETSKQVKLVSLDEAQQNKLRLF